MIGTPAGERPAARSETTYRIGARYLMTRVQVTITTRPKTAQVTQRGRRGGAAGRPSPVTTAATRPPAPERAPPRGFRRARPAGPRRRPVLPTGPPRSRAGRRT